MPSTRNAQRRSQILASAKSTRSSRRRRDINRSMMSSNEPVAQDRNGKLFHQDDVLNENETLTAIKLLNNNKSSGDIHNIVQITTAVEGEVKEWLFKLKFHSFLSNEFAH